MKNKFLSIVLILSVIVGVLAPSPKSEAASISATKVKLRVGATYTLRTSGLIGAIKWTSSKSYVASVTSGGIVTAKDAGTTTIKASTKNATLKCKVTVKKKSGAKGKKYNPKTFPKKSNKGINFTYYMEGKKIGTFNIQVTKFAYGAEAAKMALNNSSNKVPTTTQQYLFFTVRLAYKSGTQTIKMSNVFNYHKNIYGSYGAKQLKPIDYGFGMGTNENMSTVNISPGNIITADVAILVEKGFTPITFRLQTGPESYTWVKL